MYFSLLKIKIQIFYKMNFNSKKKEYEKKKRKSPIKNEKLKKKIKIKDAELLLQFSKKNREYDKKKRQNEISKEINEYYDNLNRVFPRFLRGWAELIKKNPERAKQLIADTKIYQFRKKKYLIKWKRKTFKIS